MAIRFDKAYNAKINKEVKAFNQKVARFKKRGFSNLPEQIKVSELKPRFESRRELNKELALLRKFNRSEGATEVVENMGGAQAMSWQFEYLKAQTKDAKEHYDKLISEAKKDDTTYNIAKREYLEKLKRDREFLNLDLNTIEEADLKTYEAIIKNYQKFDWRTGRYYRGFLSEVEAVMRRVNIPNKDINGFMKKFTELTPRQFLKMYNESELIHKIYDIADSPEHGQGIKLNTTEEDALDRVNSLLKQADDLVKKYKET